VELKQLVMVLEVPQAVAEAIAPITFPVAHEEQVPEPSGRQEAQPVIAAGVPAVFLQAVQVREAPVPEAMYPVAQVRATVEVQVAAFKEAVQAVQTPVALG